MWRVYKRVIRVLSSGAVDAQFQPSRSCFSLNGPGADRSRAGPFSLVAESNGGVLLTGRMLASSSLPQPPAEILVRLVPNGEVERPLTIPGGRWCDGVFSWVRWWVVNPDGTLSGAAP